MTTEMQTKLAAAFDALLAWANSAGTAAAVEAPKVVEEMIRWGLISYSVWGVMWAFLLVAFFLIFLVCKDSDEEFASVVLFIGGGCSLFGVVWNVLGVLQVYATPRLYLIEQLAGLVTGDK